MQKRFNTRAQSLFEFLAGLTVLIPIFLVILDLGLFLAAAQTNASICRDAARAAASGEPEYANLRAEAIVNSSVSVFPGTNFKLIEPVNLAIIDRPSIQIDPIDGRKINPGGAILGNTTVSTEAQVKPLVLHYLYGGSSPVKFRAQQSCPIRYVVPASNQEQSDSGAES